MTWCPADSCTLALNDIADTCTGIFAMKQSSNVVPQQGAIEEFIATALGAPTAVYTYLAMPEVWASQEKHGSFDRSAPAQNRASVLNAQAARLRNLRNEMTFAAALKQSKDPTQYVQTAHSFDGSGNSNTRRLKMATKAVHVLHTSPLLHSIVGNMDVDENRQDVDACYYDSDPEDYRPRTEKPRKAAAEEFEAAAIDEQDKRALNSIDFEKIGSQNRISRKVDDETISDIVHVSVLARPIVVRSLTCFHSHAGRHQRAVDTNVAPNANLTDTKQVSYLCEGMDRNWRIFERRYIFAPEAELVSCFAP